MSTEASTVGPADRPVVLDGRYELVSLIGRGGMADVHRGHDRLLDRPVAVKLLRDSTDSDADRARFAAEVRVLAGLDHPGLVRLYDAAADRERPYLVMELVDGSTLGELLDGGSPEPAELADIGASVAAALAHAHERGVVHRDVKPANILLDRAGRAKLGDFGIARIVGDNLRHTRTGEAIGTVAYLAPEQVTGELVGPPADVYALGLVLLESLTGERAFPGTPTEAAFARLHHSPTIPVSLPRRWPALLAAMTAQSPEDRPTAGQVADVLAELALATGPVGHEWDGPSTESVLLGFRGEDVPAEQGGRRVLLPVAAVAAAALLVLGVLTGVGGLGATPPPAEAGVTAPQSPAGKTSQRARERRTPGAEVSRGAVTATAAQTEEAGNGKTRAPRPGAGPATSAPAQQAAPAVKAPPPAKAKTKGRAGKGKSKTKGAGKPSRPGKGRGKGRR